MTKKSVAELCKEVLLLAMEGYTSNQIANKVGCPYGRVTAIRGLTFKAAKEVAEEINYAPPTHQPNSTKYRDDQSALKAEQTERIITVLKQHPNSTKNDIAQATNFSTSTVTEILRTLKKVGRVVTVSSGAHTAYAVKQPMTAQEFNAAMLPCYHLVQELKKQQE